MRKMPTKREKEKEKEKKEESRKNLTGIYKTAQNVHVKQGRTKLIKTKPTKSRVQTLSNLSP